MNPYNHDPNQHPAQYPHEPAHAPAKAQPEYTPASIAAGCLALVALLAVGGCVGMAINSNDTDDTPDEAPAAEAEASPTPTPDTEPATTDDEELDEWTEMVFTLTWEEMTPAEQEELCIEVNQVGADEASRIITDDIDAEHNIDGPTVESILTDYCL